MEIEPVACLQDNYAYLLHDPETQTTAVVDPSEAAPVQRALAARGWKLEFIWNTHHHPDHVGGNLELKAAFSCRIVAPASETARIPGMDIGVSEAAPFSFGTYEVRTLEVPGHTRGAVAYYIPGAAAVFTGDTLFLLGCGRLFEGTPEQMWHSLAKLKKLPPDTRIYCGHEYTLSNEKFTAAVAPVPALAARRIRDEALRAAGKPTVPARLAEELETNAFLRADSVEAFALLRRAKDNF